MVTVLVFGIITATAVPVMMDMTTGMRMGQALRDVERELQTARLKAVTSNRPIRVRFNCPATNEFRMVELIGTPSVPVGNDTGVQRCQETNWPFPAGDNNPLTRPNHDGPIRRIHASLAFGAASTLEFWPDGSVHRQVGTENPWTQVPSSGDGTVSITITKGTLVRTIKVNGLGKIELIR
jgi:Tfp pilus assembly protein FimT